MTVRPPRFAATASYLDAATATKTHASLIERQTGRWRRERVGYRLISPLGASRMSGLDQEAVLDLRYAGRRPRHPLGFLSRGPRAHLPPQDDLVVLRPDRDS